MKIYKYEDKEEWLRGRLGKVTGTRLKDLIIKRGTTIKDGYYKIIAERLSITEDTDEKERERGLRLEPEAIEVFKEKTGKEIITDLVIWTRDDNESIAISPDGYTDNHTEAVEVKCLASHKHIRAYLENQIPKDYEEQVLQYFIVNDSLITLYFVMYDPRVSSKPYLQFEVKRIDVQEKVDEYLELEIEVLKRIDEIVNDLSF